MKRMTELWDKLLTALPTLWGMTWLVTISIGSIALLIQSIKWLLSVLGVV
jgi:hypothetical protein